MKTQTSKRILPLLLAVALLCTSIPLVARADSSKVVTLGANLSEEQVNEMYEYFGTTADEVETIIVTNSDERKYMEGIATEEQIGTRTYSCSYVEPTDSGGIQVKVANLTFVTSSMIASTLLTAGMENCNVVAASPIAVSGTGALTGIMMAYESASGEALSEEQKETATEELVTTGELADEIGQEEASDVMNEIKETVVEDGLTSEEDIASVVDEALEKYNVSDELIEKINSLMQQISQYDLDVNALKDTMDNLSGNGEGFFASLWHSIQNFFSGNSSGNGGILNDTNDDALGAEAIINSTLGSATSSSSSSSDSESLWDRIVNWFRNLFDSIFNSQETEAVEEAETVEAEDEALSGDEDTTDVPSTEGSEENGTSNISITTEEPETSDTDGDAQNEQTQEGGSSGSGEESGEESGQSSNEGENIVIENNEE